MELLVKALRYDNDDEYDVIIDGLLIQFLLCESLKIEISKHLVMLYEYPHS